MVIMQNNDLFPKINLLPNKKRIIIPPPSPPGSSNAIDLTSKEEIEDADEEERKEELELFDDLAKLGDAVVMKKLDTILNRKFDAIFQRLKAVERREEAIIHLIKRGVDGMDGFWEFENPRYLKPLNRYYGMIDMMYAMIMEAVDFNKGVLRKKPKKE